MEKKRTGLLLSILGVVSLVLITAGVTYAFFSYTKEGETDNAISTGSITFHYDETTGSALSITDAMPMNDVNGRTQTTTSNPNPNQNSDAQAFQFSVTSTTPSTANVPYVVTIRNITGTSTLPENQVKIYLVDSGSNDASSYVNTSGTTTSVGGTYTVGSTSITLASANNKTVTNGNDNNTNVNTYATLPVESSFEWYNADAAARGVLGTDKIIYEGIVPANSKTATNSTYTRNFKLGMWLTSDSNVMNDYSAYEFVLKSAIDSETVDSKVVYDTDPLDVSDLLAVTNGILTSTDYYKKVAAGTIQSTDYTRIVKVNYDTKQVYTAAQPSTDIPSGENWETSQQFYPLNDKNFTVRINVYAEGATVYAN